MAPTIASSARDVDRLSTTVAAGGSVRYCCEQRLELGGVLVEYNINLLAPAQSETFVAVGSVLRRGRLLTVCRRDVLAISNGREKAVATM